MLQAVPSEMLPRLDGEKNSTKEKFLQLKKNASGCYCCVSGVYFDSLLRDFGGGGLIQHHVFLHHQWRFIIMGRESVTFSGNTAVSCQKEFLARFSAFVQGMGFFGEGQPFFQNQPKFVVADFG